MSHTICAGAYNIMKKTESTNPRPRGWKKAFLILLALIGGLVLSFLGFGLLWSGVAWHVQMIMVIPFLLLSYALCRWDKGAVDSCILIASGATPIALLMTQFRDTQGSHLMSVLVTLSWFIGILSGYYGNKMYPGSSKSEQDRTLP